MGEDSAETQARALPGHITAPAHASEWKGTLLAASGGFGDKLFLPALQPEALAFQGPEAPRSRGELLLQSWGSQPRRPGRGWAALEPPTAPVGLGAGPHARAPRGSRSSGPGSCPPAAVGLLQDHEVGSTQRLVRAWPSEDPCYPRNGARGLVPGHPDQGPLTGPGAQLSQKQAGGLEAGMGDMRSAGEDMAAPGARVSLHGWCSRPPKPETAAPGHRFVLCFSSPLGHSPAELGPHLGHAEMSPDPQDPAGELQTPAGELGTAASTLAQIAVPGPPGLPDRAGPSSQRAPPASPAPRASRRRSSSPPCCLRPPGSCDPRHLWGTGSSPPQPPPTELPKLWLLPLALKSRPLAALSLRTPEAAILGMCLSLRKHWGPSEPRSDVHFSCRLPSSPREPYAVPRTGAPARFVLRQTLRASRGLNGADTE